MRKISFISNVVVCVLFLSHVLLFALPEQQDVESGNAVFEKLNDTTLNITADDKTTINFKSFNIASNETVNFIQPSQSSTCLSRVTGPNASYIYGTLTANGVLLLVNPHGINFGPSANVQVNAFIASTLDISTNNFVNANYMFEHDINAEYARVLNEGVMQGNNIALIGSAVNNSGIIQARAGNVHLASGDKTTVSFDSKGLIQVVVNEKTSGKVIDANGTSVKDAIANSGTIEAGKVFMSGKIANDVFENAVNQTGVVKASGLVEENGVIKVVADKNIKVSGTLEASATEVVSEDSIIVDLPLIVKGETEILANNNITTRADINAVNSSLHLFADYEGNGVGEFSQLSGTIKATGVGNIAIDGSGTMTLGAISTDYGYIKIGTERAPASIAGNPHYIHTQGDFEITEKQESQGVAVLKTSRGDELRYNAQGDLTLEAERGKIADLGPDPLSSHYLTLIGNEFFVNSLSATTHIFKNNGDIYISNATPMGELIVIEGINFGRVGYLKTHNVTLQTDQDVTTSPGILIQGNEVKVIGRKLGSADTPLAIDAAVTHIRRTNGTIDIVESTGLGTSILIRGPPDGFGAIVYSPNTHLILEAEGTSVPTASPTYFYGDITFYNFECITPGKEIYFQAGKTYTFKGNLHLEIIPSPNWPIYLRSSERGTFWYIRADTDSYYLYGISVEDSYNLGATPLVAHPARNEGNNINWNLNTITWAGTTSNWSTATNWNPNGSPEGQAVEFTSGSVDSTVDQEYSILSLTITSGYSGTITVAKNLTVNGAASIASTAIVQLDGTSNTVTWTQGNGTTLSNSGVFRVYDDTNACTLTSSGTFTFTGTEPDYYSNTLKLGKCDLQTDTTIGSGEKLEIIANCTVDGITVNSGGEFACTTDGVTITGSSSEDITVNSGGTIRFNPSSYSSGITVTGYRAMYIYGASTIDFNHLTAISGAFDAVTVQALGGTPTVTNFANSTFTGGPFSGSGLVLEYYTSSFFTATNCVFNSTTSTALYGYGSYFSGTGCTFNGKDGGSYNNEDIYNDDGKILLTDCAYTTVGIHDETYWHSYIISKDTTDKTWDIYGNYNSSWPDAGWKGSDIASDYTVALQAADAAVTTGGTFTMDESISCTSLTIDANKTWQLNANTPTQTVTLSLDGSASGTLTNNGTITDGGLTATDYAEITSSDATDIAVNGGTVVADTNLIRIRDATVSDTDNTGSGTINAWGCTEGSGNSGNRDFSALGTSFNDASNGNWNDGATWGHASPGVEGVDYPGLTDEVTIDSHTVSVVNNSAKSGDITIGASGTLRLNGSAGAATLTVRANGIVSNSGAIQVQDSTNACTIQANSGIVYVSGTEWDYNSRTLNISGLDAGFDTTLGSSEKLNITGNCTIDGVTVNSGGEFACTTDGVTITGDAGKDITLNSGGTLRFNPSSYSSGITVTGFNRIYITGGTIDFNHLTATSADNDGVYINGQPTVTNFTNSSITGKGSYRALFLTNFTSSYFTVSNCTFTSSSYTAVYVNNAYFKATGCTFSGEDGGNYDDEDIYSASSARIELADCTFTTVGIFDETASNNLIVHKHTTNKTWDMWGNFSSSLPESGFKGSDITSDYVVTLHVADAASTSGGTFTQDEDISCKSLVIDAGKTWQLNKSSPTAAVYLYLDGSAGGTLTNSGSITTGTLTAANRAGILSNDTSLIAITGGTITANNDYVYMRRATVSGMNNNGTGTINAKGCTNGGSNSGSWDFGANSFNDAANGNWNAGATWGNVNGNIEHIDYPGTGCSATIDSHTVSVINSSAACGSITISGSGILQLDGSSASATLTMDNGSTLANSGAFKVANSTNNCTLTSSGTFTFTGTEPDYNGKTLRLGNCDLQMDTTIGSGEKLEIIANCTVDGVTVNSGGEFACTTDGVTITGDSSKDIAVYSGGTLTFNPSTYVTGITATGMHSLYVENGTININHLTASSGNSHTLSLNGSGLTVTNLTNSTFTNNVSQTFSAIYVAGYANVTATYCNFNSNGGGYGGYMYFFGTLNATSCNFNSPDGAAAGVFFFGTLNATGCTFNGKDGAYWGADIYNKDLGKAYLTDCTFTTVSFFHQDYAGYPIISKNTTDKTWDMWGTFSSSEPAAGWKGSDIPSDYAASYKETDYTYYEGDTTFTMNEDISCKSLNIDSGTTWQLNANTPTETVTLSLDGSAGGTLTNNGTIIDGGLTATHYAEIASSDATNITVNGGTVVADTNLIRIRDATVSDTDNTGSGTINAWGCTEGSGNSGNRDFGALGTSFNDAASGNWNDGATWGHASPGVEGVDYPGLIDEVTIDSHTVSVVNNSAKSGDITIGAAGTLRLNGSAGAATLTVRANGIVSNSGVIQVQDSANACTIQANSGIVYVSGTEWDYNSRTLNISGLDAGFDTTLGSSEKLNITGNCTIDGVTVNSGGEFSCTTDGVAITGDASKDITLNSGGTLRFNPSSYSSGITVTGYNRIYVTGGTIDFNHLTATSADNYGIYISGSPTITNFTNSNLTGSGSYNAMYLTSFTDSYFTVSSCTFTSSSYSSVWVNNAYFKATGCTFSGEDGGNYDDEDLCFGCAGSSRVELTDSTFTTVGISNEGYADSFIIHKNTATKTWDMWGNFSSSLPESGFKGSDIPSDYTVTLQKADAVSTGGGTFTQDESISCKSLTIDSGKTWQINKSSPTAAVTLSLDGSAGGTLTNNGTITFGTLTAANKATITSSDTTKVVWSGNAPTWTSYVHLGYADLKTNNVSFTTGANAIYIDNPCDFFHVTISGSGTLDDSSNSDISVGGAWANSGSFISGTSTVTFDVANSSNITTGGTGDTKDFYGFTVNKPGGGIAVITDGLDIDGPLTVTAGILHANQDVYAYGATSIDTDGTIRLDGGSNAVTFYQGNGTTLSNSGVFQVYNDTNNCTLTSGGTFTFTGTEPDYNTNTLRLGNCDLQMDTTIGSGEKLEIIANCTIDGVHVDSGGEFACTTDGVTITGNSSKDITLNTGGTLTFNPSAYSSGITVAGYRGIIINGGTININYLAATSANYYAIYISGTPTFTNLTNSTFTGGGVYNAIFVGAFYSFPTISNCIFNASSTAAILVNGVYLKATNCIFNGEDGGNYNDEDIYMNGGRLELDSCTFTTIGFYNEPGINSFVVHKNASAKTWDMWGTFSSSLPESGFKGSDIPADYIVTLQKADAALTGGGTFIQDENITCKSLTVDAGMTWQINKTTPTSAVTLSLDGSAGGTLTNNGTITFGTLTAANKATITSSDTTKVVWSGNAPTWTSYVHLGYADLKTNNVSFTTGANAIYVDTDCDFKDVTISNSGTLDNSANAAISVGGNWDNSGTGTWTSGTATLTFTGNGTNTINSGGTTDAKDFSGFTVDKSGGSLQITGNALDIDGTLTITNGTLTVSKDLYANGATSIGASGTLQLDGASNTVTMYQANGTTLSNSGSFKVYNDTNNCTLTSGGTFTFTGTEPDYNTNTLRLGKCDLQTDTTIGNGEGLVLVGPMTMDGVTLASGGSFDVNGQTLALTSYSQTGGAFTAGASDITSYGSFSVTGGTFNATASTITLDATNGSLSLIGNGYTFNNVIFKNNSSGSARTITLGDGPSQAMNFSGHFHLDAAASKDLTVTAATHDPAVTIAGDVDYIGIGGGQEYISMGSGVWTVSGNWYPSPGISVTTGNSTLIMNGTNKVMDATASDFYNLTISGTITRESSGSTTTTVNHAAVISGTFTLSGSGTELLIGSNGSIDLTGGTINGEGMLTIYPGVALGTEGAIDVATTFGYHSGLGPDPVIPARLFGGDVTLITGAGSSPGGTGRIAAGTLTINGNLYLQANSDDPVILLLDGAANNPTVNISGDIAYTGAAASTESISMGNGTWTVGGDVDFTGGTVTAGGSTLKLNGSSGQTVTSNGQSLNAITITNASAGGVTFADRLQCATLTDTTNGSTIKFSAASAGARHTVSNTLTMTGGSGSDMITLAPQTPATVWYFSPPFGTTVTGVSVCYSNSDKTITANSSTNGGNNTNWVFGGAPPTPPTPKFDWQELAQVLTENELGLYQVYFLRYDLFSGTFLPDPRFTISPEFLESLVRK